MVRNGICTRAPSRRMRPIDVAAKSMGGSAWFLREAAAWPGIRAVQVNGGSEFMAECRALGLARRVLEPAPGRTHLRRHERDVATLPRLLQPPRSDCRKPLITLNIHKGKIASTMRFHIVRTATSRKISAFREARRRLHWQEKLASSGRAGEPDNAAILKL